MRETVVAGVAALPAWAPEGNTRLFALSAKWRGEAAILRANGASPQAELVERHAGELEATLLESDSEEVTPEQAASISGYSSDHLRRLAREGRLTNYGTDTKARYRRSDLPRKPGLRETASDCTVPVTREQIARAVVN